MKLPPMNSLKAFEAVARLGSVSAAAAELCVSHGAVSQQVRVLERFLGRELFVRTGNALALSEAGEAYATTVYKALSSIAAETASLMDAPEPVRLKVSAPPTFAVKWLIPNLPRFHNAHIGIEISVDVSSKVVRLGGEGPHAAIRFGADRDPDLDYIEILEPTIRIVGSPAYFKRRGRVRSIDELPEHHLIDFGAASRRHAALHVGWVDVLGEAPKDTIRLAEEHLALAAALEGRGLVIVEDLFVRSDVASKRLRFALSQGFPSKAAYRLAMPRRSTRKRALETFAGWLKAELKT